MYPKVIALSGPLRGSTYDLKESRIEVGRLASSQISIPDQAVSRRHCVFEAEGEHVVLRDLDSRNGTRVNGIPIREHVLENGDVIEMGDSQVLFLLTEPRSDGQRPLVTIRETNLDPSATVIARPATGRGHGRLTHSDSTARKAHYFDVLLKISRALASARNMESLAQELLATILQVIPAS
ncbi:MAG TPA: FHA domain-containing protein, partial [Terriglobia bacterium]|nr:FHA domain-containing protein [Terriglobia bacterium]